MQQDSDEFAVTFDCAGSPLLGIVHQPVQPCQVGIVCVIAGGPQYRAGVGRNMVLMARELAGKGVAVLRFDHRGLGDSDGEFLGFEHTREDIQAAVECLIRSVPAVKKVVLWGGCDAASGCMIHGSSIEGVTSMVLGNPWITTASTQSIVRRQHYKARLREWSFWRKLLRREYDLRGYGRSALRRLRPRKSALRRLRLRRKMPIDAAAPAAVESNWMKRMLEGLRTFDGPILFLMSGQSMVSHEFDALVKRERSWGEAYRRARHERIDLPDADQTFSSADSRDRVNTALYEWVLKLDGVA